MSGRLTVHLRVNDAATGQPTPVRLLLTGPEGEYYAPFGRTIEFPYGRNEAVGGHVALGDKRFTYIDGSCEIGLPAGVPLQIGISKGPEYQPLREMVTLGGDRGDRRRLDSGTLSAKREVGLVFAAGPRSYFAGVRRAGREADNACSRCRTLAAKGHRADPRLVRTPRPLCPRAKQRTSAGNV